MPGPAAHLEQRIFSLRPGDAESFRETAGDVLDFQRRAVPAYRTYADRVDVPAGWNFPYLPIRAFKLGRLCAGEPEQCELSFRSSGTGGLRSRHDVLRADVYRRSITTEFRRRVGSGPFTLVFYLPDYEEAAQDSSLLYMTRVLQEAFGDERSGSYLARPDEIADAAEWSVRNDRRLIVFGAAFGLLDLAERSRLPTLPEGSVVVETGGMKTRRRTVTREELHSTLVDATGVGREQVWSEYGMCEMLSQLYSRGRYPFLCPPWVRAQIINPESLEVVPAGEPGALAVTDLANLYSVSAILTEDRARRKDGGVEILGRLSGAELRGCNFLLEQ